MYLLNGTFIAPEPLLLIPLVLVHFLLVIDSYDSSCVRSVFSYIPDLAYPSLHSFAQF